MARLTLVNICYFFSFFRPVAAVGCLSSSARARADVALNCRRGVVRIVTARRVEGKKKKRKKYPCSVHLKSKN